MSHYRDLNKELVEQVQTMRLNMKLCCDEILQLKEELMRRREAEVLLRKQCYNLAVNNFVQMVQIVEPDNDILPFLKEHIQTQDRIYSSILHSTESRSVSKSKTPCEKASDARSRSSLLALELRRCNSIINLRKSQCNASPIRSSSKEKSDEIDDEENDGSIRNTEVENVVTTEEELAQTEPLQPVENGLSNSTIYEESDDEEENYSHDLDVESISESVEEIDTSMRRITLKDVTNTYINTTDPPKEERSEAIHKRELNKESRWTILTDKENTGSVHSTSVELCANPLITTSKINKPTRLTDNSVIEIEEETLQQPRRRTNCSSAWSTNKSFCINQETLISPSSVYTNMTLRNFDHAACSTPNSEENFSLRAQSQSTITKCVLDLESPAFSSTSVSERPSRKCKPKCLAEPKIMGKFRNEFETKTKSKKRRKSRSRKQK